MAISCSRLAAIDPRSAGPILGAQVNPQLATRRAAENAGERLLRDLTAGPGQVPAVRSRLRATHFARPRHRHLYGLIWDMPAAGRPVDPGDCRLGSCPSGHRSP